MAHQRSYYSSFRQGHAAYYPQPYHHETDEERRRRKAREERDRQAKEAREHSRYEHERHELEYGRDSQQGKKGHDYPRRDHGEHDSRKRHRDTGHSASSSQPRVVDRATSTGGDIDLASDAPALQSTDLEIILNRPKYQLPPGPPILQSRFKDWCLKGVKFDLDLRPINKEAMMQHIEAVKEDVAQVDLCYRLANQLQQINRANQEAMITMESDKEEWKKVLETHKKEMNEATTLNAQLTEEIKRLKSEMASAELLHKTREDLQNDQLAAAHTAQRRAEEALAAERSQVETRQAEVNRLREASEAQTQEINTLKAQTSSQAQEIEALKKQLAQAQMERDEAVAGKLQAEDDHEATKAERETTMFDFFVCCVMSRGSLNFLGPDFDVILAEVWEKVLEKLANSGDTEEILQERYLDEESRRALVVGRERLAKERAEAALLTETRTSAGVGEGTSAGAITQHSSEPTPEDSDKESSQEALGFEVDVRPPPPAGNFSLNEQPLQQDDMYTPYGFEDYLTPYPADYDTFNFSYSENPNVIFSPSTVTTVMTSLAEAIAPTHVSASPQVTSAGQTTTHPPPASTLDAAPSDPLQLSQSEQIGALQGLDETIASQDKDAEEKDDEEREKTPEPKAGDKSLDVESSGKKDGSSGKKRVKHAAVKRKRHLIKEGETTPEEQTPITLSSSDQTPDVPPKRLEKLKFKPGKDTKGGKKKK